MLRLSVFILTIMLIYAGAYFVMGMIYPKLIVESTVKGAIGKTLEEAQNDGYLKAFIALNRDVGLFGLAFVLLSLFILFSAYRKARKWAWFAFLLTGLFGWLGALILSISIGDVLNILIRLIGTSLALFGLIVPIKAFFGRKSDQTEGV